MRKSCPVIGTSFKDLVSKLNGDEDLAYTLYFRYGDDVYDMTTEDLAPYTGNKIIEGVIEEEIPSFKQTITQDNKSYYRGQIEEPTIDKDGNLVLYVNYI